METATVIPAIPVGITVSPATATVAAGGTQQFQATVTGTTNTAVQWEVNNIAGGNAQFGTISTTGLYTAPTPVVTLQVTVTAVSNADSTKTANATVIVNAVVTPPPVITCYCLPSLRNRGRLPDPAVHRDRDWHNQHGGDVVGGWRGRRERDRRHHQHQWHLHSAGDVSAHTPSPLPAWLIAPRAPVPPLPSLVLPYLRQPQCWPRSEPDSSLQRLREPPTRQLPGRSMACWAATAAWARSPLEGFTPRPLAPGSLHYNGNQRRVANLQC